MRLPLLAAAICLFAMGFAACSSSTTAPTPPNLGANIYYTYFNNTPAPQLAIVAQPLNNASVSTLVNGTVGNGLYQAEAIAFDPSGRLWVANRIPPCCTNMLMKVFSLPISPTSTPLFTITLTGTNNVIALTFDPSGNLWVQSENNTSVFEYAGPFSGNATVGPSLTLTNGLNSPTALAFDHSGNLYVTNFSSAGANSVAVFNAPITNGEAESIHLDGITAPAGIAFDAAGNLYVGSGGTVSAPGPIFRYNVGNLINAATPNITDSTGLLNDSYASQLAFDPAGNLYDADCGNPAKIYVFPTGSQTFSSTLAPSLTYAESNIVTSNCVWGIAIR